MSEELTRRMVGIGVLLAVFSLIAWWIGSRDSATSEIPPATAQVRNYDIRDLDRIASAQQADQPIAEPVLEPADPASSEKPSEQSQAPDEQTSAAAAEPAKAESKTPAKADPEKKPVVEKAPEAKPAPKPEPKPEPVPVAPPKPAKAAKPPTDAKGKWIVQVASVTQKPNAQALVERLKKQSWNSFLAQGEVNGKTYYRVRVGYYAARGQAEEAGKQLKAALKQDVRVMTR